MGCSFSRTEDDAVNEDINAGIRSKKKLLELEIKLLLLGTGESGKSTFAKQFKILHLNGFSKEELMTYRPVFSNNILTAMRNILEAAKKFDLLGPLESDDAAQYFLKSDPLKDEVSPKTAAYVSQLWETQAVKDTILRYREFQLPDSTSYLVANAEKMCSKDFVPSEEDILHCRARTTGIVEIDFTIDKMNFRVIDVGGQRSERKKWIHCFEGVTGIIFCVALNEFDQKLFEDERVNRMQEALELFGEVCNSEWFTKTDIILFLNKYDLYLEKMKTSNLATCFPDYKGGNDPDLGIEFIKKQFVTLVKTEGKQIYHHVTTATDTENVRVVFAATKNIILNRNLEGAGFG